MADSMKLSLFKDLGTPAHKWVLFRGVRTAEADICGPGSADFLADADGPSASADPPNKHICGRGPSADLSHAFVCRTNLKRKCQCTSSQQFKNRSTLGHCSRLCKKACLTVSQ